MRAGIGGIDPCTGGLQQFVQSCLYGLECGPVVIAAPDTRLVCHDYDRDTGGIRRFHSGDGIIDQPHIVRRRNIIDEVNQRAVPVEKQGRPEGQEILCPDIAPDAVGFDQSHFRTINNFALIFEGE